MWQHINHWDPEIADLCALYHPDFPNWGSKSCCTFISHSLSSVKVAVDLQNLCNWFENVCALQVTIRQSINSVSHFLIITWTTIPSVVNFNYTNAEHPQLSKNLPFALLLQHINYWDPEKAINTSQISRSAYTIKTVQTPLIKNAKRVTMGQSKQKTSPFSIFRLQLLYFNIAIKLFWVNIKRKFDTRSLDIKAQKHSSIVEIVFKILRKILPAWLVLERIYKFWLLLFSSLCDECVLTV